MRDRLCEGLTAAGVPWLIVAGDGPGCEIVYRPDATAPQRAAGDAILAGFDWSQAAHQAWEFQRAVAAAVADTMTGTTPGRISDRVILRYVLTLINDEREAAARPRILEAEHLARIQAAVAAGAGLPAG